MGQAVSADSIGSIGTHNAFANLYEGERASEEMQRGQRRANALYREQFTGAQADYKPYQEGGTSALEALMRTYGLGADQGGVPDYSGFENSPDYQFALQQGQQSLDRSAASRGRLYSGAQMQASQRFGQGLATQNLGNYRAGLQGLSGQGLNAVNALSNYRMGYSNQLGAGLTGIGDIRAAEHLGRAGMNANRQNQMAANPPWGQQQQQPNALQGGGGQSSYGGSTFGLTEADYAGPMYGQ